MTHRIPSALRPLSVALVFSLGLSACGKAPGTGSGTVVPPSAELMEKDPALVVVQSFHLGSNLATMSEQVAVSTVSYGVLVQRLGASGASSAVQREISALLPAYQPQWDRNLADSYSQVMSGTELRSIATQGQQSPYADKFIAARPRAGALMQASSRPILEKLVSAALRNALAKAAPGEQASK